MPTECGISIMTTIRKVSILNMITTRIKIKDKEMP